MFDPLHLSFPLPPSLYCDNFPSPLPSCLHHVNSLSHHASCLNHDNPLFPVPPRLPVDLILFGSLTIKKIQKRQSFVRQHDKSAGLIVSTLPIVYFRGWWEVLRTYWPTTRREKALPPREWTFCSDQSAASRNETRRGQVFWGAV